jgi:hypothetical protein
MRLTLRRATLPTALAVAMAFSGSSALAQDLPAPVDQPYQGTLGLTVDLTDAPKNIYHVRETIPVAAGPLTLFYPKWIPGEHSPSGPIQNVAGLTISANGKPLAWRRNLKEMYALHVDVPAGVDKLDVAFEFLAPREAGGFSSSPSSTPNFVALEFNQVAFYPAGYYTSRIMIQPTVKLPAGWKFASSLETDTPDSASPSFKAVSFENLVDSPLIAGRHFNRVDLAPGAQTAVHLNVVGDSAASVKATDKQIAGQRALIVQANKLFGAHHYSHYDFLLINSDHTQHFGLEHHQSSDDRLFANFFTDADVNVAAGSLLPHEYIHSWNGKFRRPADLWTPTFTETRWPTSRPACPTAPAARGVRCRTPPTRRRSPMQAVAAGPTIAAVRTSIPKASCSGSTWTRRSATSPAASIRSTISRVRSTAWITVTTRRRLTPSTMS